MKLYTDGSTIMKNPSPYGGTYAWIVVNSANKAVMTGSGVYTPDKIGADVVTNNQMELVAILHGLQAARTKGHVIREIVSDSRITLGRLFDGWRLKNVPDWMIEMMDNTSLRGVRGTFVKGHSGDYWNEMADKMTNDEGVAFLQSKGLDDMIYQYLNPWWKNKRWKNRSVKP
jgi:ribonuclease HI